MKSPFGMQGASELFEEFNRYFELSVATNEEQRAAVYEVRYRVYCEEFGYESKESFLNGQETDEFDASSLHCLVTHRETRRPAGCVRLVLPEGNLQMPMEVHSGDAIDQGFMSKFASARHSICEISRLAADGAFRRRSKEKETRFGAQESLSFDENERRTFPLIAVSLFIASAAAADVLGRKHLFAIMEPFLPIMLRRTGVDFSRIGQDFEFRGTRAPYYGNVDNLVNKAPPEIKNAFYAVREVFKDAMFPGQTELHRQAS